MDYCEIRQSPKSRILKEMSGSSENLVLRTIQHYQDKYGRDPKLDEIPMCDSEKYLKEKLKLKEGDYTNKDILLEETGASNIEEALILLNKEFSDKFVEVLDLGGNAVIVKIRQRPTVFTDAPITVLADMNFSIPKNKLVIVNALDRLRKYCGYDIVHITNEDILKSPELKLLNADLANAFIYNGTIYINSDNAKIDGPIHEMLHLFIGNIRFQNPSLYMKFIEMAEGASSLNEIQKLYGNRSHNDLLEETFVSELASFLTDLSSMFDDLSPTEISEIFYSMKRDIDTILDGEVSVGIFDTKSIFKSSIMQLAKGVGSSVTTFENMGNIDAAFIHRILGNTKEQLIKDNKLELVCE